MAFAVEFVEQGFEFVFLDVVDCVFGVVCRAGGATYVGVGGGIVCRARGATYVGVGGGSAAVSVSAAAVSSSDSGWESLWRVSRSSLSAASGSSRACN